MSDFCLNKKCGKKLSHVEGRRKKQYCNSTCKYASWYESNKRGKVLEYRVSKKKVAIKDLTKPTSQVKPIEQPKSNLTVDTKKHPLYKEGDPKEGSGAFYLKYDCMNYDELSLKK